MTNETTEDRTSSTQLMVVVKFETDVKIRPEVGASGHVNGNDGPKNDTSTNGRMPYKQQRSKRSKNEINYRE